MAFLCLLATTLSAQEPATYTYYVLGQFVTKPLDQIASDEEWGRQGHMPWRTEPALVASVEAGDLMPAIGVAGELSGEEAREGAWLSWTIRDPATEVTFEVVEESQDVATVAMIVNGARAATVWLERPLGYWWYIRTVETAEGVVAEPPAPGSVRWVSLRDVLGVRGFGVYWSAPQRRVVAVKGESRLELTVGDPEIHINGRSVRIDAPPKLLESRVLVPRYVITDLLSEESALQAALVK